MKIVLISDTHLQHSKLRLPEGDILIHAGDVTSHGTEGEVLTFVKWFERQNFQYKIFIAGNYDFFFENETEKYLSKIIPGNTIYLNDSGVTINGIHIWGSPITPWFYDWAFNRRRGKDIGRHWKLIPQATDILITHGPPYGILDKNRANASVGCLSLKRKVLKIKPRLHMFGHIHEGYGQTTTRDTTFINASVLNEKYELVNEPQSFIV